MIVGYVAAPQAPLAVEGLLCGLDALRRCRSIGACGCPASAVRMVRSASFCHCVRSRGYLVEWWGEAGRRVRLEHEGMPVAELSLTTSERSCRGSVQSARRTGGCGRGGCRTCSEGDRRAAAESRSSDPRSRSRSGIGDTVELHCFCTPRGSQRPISRWPTSPAHSAPRSGAFLSFHQGCGRSCRDRLLPLSSAWSA